MHRFALAAILAAAAGLAHAQGRIFSYEAELAQAARRAAVLAQDSLLDVPVRVANVPAAASVGSVTCAVFADPAGPTSNVGYLGSGSRWFALANGGFAGRITVPVRFDAGPGPARGYRCAVYFILKDEGRTLTLRRAGSPTGISVRPKAGMARKKM